MSDFKAKTVCILGRQPQLGLAELESVYGAEHVRALPPQTALLDIDSSAINFMNLGGTIKVAKILADLPASWPQIEKYLLSSVPEHLQHLPEGKFTLGLSVYGIDVKPELINKTNLKIKRLVKASGRPMRVVPNKSTSLNSAQVLHNGLTKKGGWELLVISSGNKNILAQTMFVQDIESYGARDQSRPRRDTRVGMLPPKLAQIIINLAVGHKKDSSQTVLLDPFCGTGVVLQEAILMNYRAVGTDLEPRMIEFSQINLEWLKEKYPKSADFSLSIGDATKTKWPQQITNVASEVFLGTPLNKLPDNVVLKKIITDVDTITKKFLINLAGQLKSGTRLCLAVPAWRHKNGTFIHLPLIDRLSDLGYNFIDFKQAEREKLIYFREDQTVARQLLILNKV